MASSIDRNVQRLSGGLDRPTLVVAGVATLGLVMATLDTTIVNVALDTLSRDLGAPLSTIQWVSTGYLLSLAAVIPLSGWITERFGSKRTWIASIMLFAIGSALCALATSAGELIAFRVVQGVGGGMLVPVGFTLVAQSAGPRRVGRGLALVGVPLLLGPIFGPIIGGLIVDSAAWQWIFVVNVPIAIVAIFTAARSLVPDAGRADAGALDWLGAALLCPGLAGIVFGLSEIEGHGGIGRPIAFAPILAGFALVGLFAWHSLRVARPLIEVRLFRIRGFRAAATATFLFGGALFGALLVLPLYYQVDRGESALDAGLLLAPQGLGAALMLPISGRLTDRIGGGPVVVAGVTILAVATVPFAFVSDHTPYALLGGVLFVRGLGLGASIQPTTASAYALLDSSQVPRATAALNMLRQIGASIGTALLAAVLQHESKAALASAGGGGAGGLLAPLPASEREQISGPVATAFGHTFMWAVALALLAILPAVALLRAERAERGTSAEDPACARGRMPRIRRAADDVRGLPRNHRTMPKTTTRRRLRAGAAIAVVAATAAVLVGAGGAQTPPAVVIPESGSVAAIQTQFTDVVARVSPTVVQIQTPRGLGSGIVYDADGNVVTNAHVTSGAKSFVVTLANGERHPAKLVGADPGNDLAVIHIFGATPDPASFGDSSKVRAGEISFAIGNPLGLRSSVTQGIVSSVSRSVSEGNGVTLSQAIQTSAEINPGNSGGALVDLSGRVIGIPTLAALDPEFGGGAQAPGIGFAIPSSMVQRVANQLIRQAGVS